MVVVETFVVESSPSETSNTLASCVQSLLAVLQYHTLRAKSAPRHAMGTAVNLLVI